MLSTIIEHNTYHPIVHICSFCEKILSNSGGWERFGDYIRKHPYADVSHGICPGCLEEYFPEEYLAICADKKSEGRELTA